MIGIFLATPEPKGAQGKVTWDLKQDPHGFTGSILPCGNIPPGMKRDPGPEAMSLPARQGQAMALALRSSFVCVFFTALPSSLGLSHRVAPTHPVSRLER